MKHLQQKMKTFKQHVRIEHVAINKTVFIYIDA